MLVIGGDATGVFAGGADTIGRLTALAEAVERVGSRYGVDALTRGELEKVFELIARAAGCTWESDLLTRLLNDVGRTAQAMAHAGLVASELWQRQTHGMLTHAAYGEIGGVGGVLSRAADAAIAGLIRRRAMQAERVV